MLRVNMTAEKNGVWNRIENVLKAAKGIVSVSGVTGTGVAASAAFIAGKRKQSFIMTASYERGKRLCADLSFFIEHDKKPIFLLPEENRFLMQYEAKSHADLEQRLAAVTALLKGEPCIIIGTPESILKKMVPKAYFVENILYFCVGRDAELEQVRKSLSAMGYEYAPLVESKGQFSIRGGMIDVFPPNEKNPVRIELFDTEIDSIRFFDPVSQRSVKACEETTIYPAQNMVHDPVRFQQAGEKIKECYKRAVEKLKGPAAQKITERMERLLEFIEEGINLQLLENYLRYFYDSFETMIDYADEESMLIMDDSDRIHSRMALSAEELQVDFDILMEKGEALPEDFDTEYTQIQLQEIMAKKLVCCLNPFAATDVNQKLIETISVSTKQTTLYYGKMDVLAEDLRRYIQKEYKVIISCSGAERHKNLREFLERNGIFVSAVQLIIGELSTGTEWIDEKLVIISDRDIFAATKRKRKAIQRKDAKPIKIFTEIKQGDYIVHENHGIGKFIGIEQRNFEGVIKDYLKIKYAGEDFLYVPVAQMDILQKYVGSEGSAPKINKLTGSEWKKTKVRAEIAIARMAKELMELSAKRKTLQGYAFAPDTAWQSDFEEMFPYVETEDQLKCVREIKRDMEKPEIMERLLCGDVGYGKTEVAARAAFKCAAEGKQVAILVPTTILANQHYHTFRQRFEKFPIQIEMLSRFRNEKQQREVIQKIKDGYLDIIIGTHRILSKDVSFKDLGLLIIDEEHRFGVRHKEVIKSLKNKVDVLTLSATPIPRTLHMSLSGIRDMSVIEEPPEERYPVQTYVMEQDDEVLREVLRREIERDGQVFIVYNRVQGIRKVAHYIETLVPEALIAVGHGQMNEKELENIMADFMEKRYNVLVATTIIESGIDISNANTIIILDADKFGLSQLYQLRGRVGRSTRMAYAYLFYQRSKLLTEVAEKRLRAIREFTEFGSGFKIAMRDLEIRGAGNLLGTEQSGHMMSIGYELYCKLLDDAVKALSDTGETKDGEDEKEISIEFRADAYISGDYIHDEVIKLQMYKKISEMRTEEEEIEVRDELLDRFGDIPASTENLICLARIKAMGQTVGIQKIGEEKQQVVCEFYEKNKLHPDMVAALLRDYGMRVTIFGKTKPGILFHIDPKQNKIKETKSLLNKLLMAGV